VGETAGNSRSAGGGSGLPNQAGQGGEGGPGIGEISQGFGSRLAEYGQAFQVPAFEGGIAAFRGIACAVVEAFPGRSADGEVTHQADGAVGEALTDVDNASMRVVGGLIGALDRWVGDAVEGDLGGCAMQAGVLADPLVAMAGGIEAIGGEGIAKGAHRAALVIVAAERPQAFVLIGDMGTQVDHP